MHPILFHIPLPKTQVAALYFYLAVIAIGVIYAAAQWFVWKSKSNAIGGLVLAAIGVVAKLAGVIEKWTVDKNATDVAPGMIPIGPIPIYSYGVMLGLSLVVGWYLTLGLAERDGLPKETMANNYVVTAIAAIAGSRILYVLTNLNEFESPMDIFALRRGGLVAYGGFLGGFVGSLYYLRKHRIPLLPWADVAVPSLASGLMITRIGCYLFGCDFGRPLAENDPAWLKGLGTFPRWAPGLLHEGNPSEGSPAWAQHVKQKLIDASAPTSLPVHPTQIYESLVGAGLLALLLLSRRKQKFRGQIFLLFTFAYGVCRYLLEILRDDEERGSLPFSAGKHVMVPLGLAIFAAGFAFGFSKLIKNPVVLRVAQGIAFIPAIVMYFAMAPASYGASAPYQWSTSQFVAITTGFAACVAFAVFYKAALAHPERAMLIPLPPPEEELQADADTAKDDADADADEEEEAPAKKPVAKKPAAKADVSTKPKAKSAAADDDEAPAKKPVAKKKAVAKKPAPKPIAADDEESGDKDEAASKKAEKGDDEEKSGASEKADDEADK